MHFIKDHANNIVFGFIFLFFGLIIPPFTFQYIYGFGLLLLSIIILCCINLLGIKKLTYHAEWKVLSPQKREKTIIDTVDLKINRNTMSVKGIGKLDTGKTYSIIGKLSGQTIRLSFNGTGQHEKEMAGCILLDLTPDSDNLKGSWSQKSSNSHHLTGTVKFCQDRNNLNAI